MRKDRERLVRERFTQQLTGSLPQLEKAYFGEHWPDMPCYRWRIAKGLTAYVSLQSDDKDDRIQIILTWMLTGLQPAFARHGAPGDEPNKDGLTINLGLLWSRNAFQWKVKYSPTNEELSAWLDKNPDFTDPIRDEEARKVFARVDDAVQRIINYGIPYLVKVADGYGICFVNREPGDDILSPTP